VATFRQAISSTSPAAASRIRSGRSSRGRRLSSPRPAVADAGTQPHHHGAPPQRAVGEHRLLGAPPAPGLQRRAGAQHQPHIGGLHRVQAQEALGRQASLVASTPPKRTSALRGASSGDRRSQLACLSSASSASHSGATMACAAGCSFWW
jgi:hypothetical protein